ncbi:hypothetical protein [uncultured Methanospirillum sp.]|uniref:hypothetical protein n=1 Tax=uncultured Methanospirillum sp. TaxID=262503 RepID=UPI0029C63BBF|nr:hypothetical protein [uncultured Methanospirillum sp.]
MDNIEQITRAMEDLVKQVHSLTIQTTTLTTILELSNKEIRKCIDNHELRLRDVEKDSP